MLLCVTPARFPFAQSNRARLCRPQGKLVAEQWKGVANVMTMICNDKDFPEFFKVVQKHDGKATFSPNKLREFGQMLQQPYCKSFMKWVINPASQVTAASVGKQLVQLRQLMYA